MLSEANSEAKEDVGIGWSAPGQKGCVCQLGLEGEGEESLDCTGHLQHGARRGRGVFGVSSRLCRLVFLCMIKLRPWSEQYR